MAVTQAQVDAQRQKIVDFGDVVSSEFGDRVTHFAALKVQQDLLTWMLSEMDDAASTPRSKQRLAYHSGKGL